MTKKNDQTRNADQNTAHSGTGPAVYDRDAKPQYRNAGTAAKNALTLNKVIPDAVDFT